MVSKRMATRNGRTTPHPYLQRQTFRTSREMDFFSERELVTQTGHDRREWPLVIAKELIDNALDACEEADTPPAVEVTADDAGVTVRDNGPGLPESTLQAAMDFTVRASNREAYVSPCRGAQGNALKTLLPMPWVVNPDEGRVLVTANGIRHTIRCGIDQISQRPVVRHGTEPICKKQHSRNGDKKASFLSGTEVRVEWGSQRGSSLWPDEVFETPVGRWECILAAQFRDLVEGYAVFNPHASLSLDWFGRKACWAATQTDWAKWKPHQPTSAHWYEPRHLERLIGAYVTHARDHGGPDRPVSEFLAEFDGLSGSQKRTKVLEEAGLKRVRLSELVAGDRLDAVRLAALLAAMQRHTKPVKPQRLGIIGEDHLRARLEAMGCQPESFNYKRKVAKDGLPWVLESAFGWLGNEASNARRIFSGANWSSAIKNPFRSFGSTGEGLEGTLAELWANRNEPIVFVLHLVHPRVEYTDRGKSALVVGDES